MDKKALPYLILAALTSGVVLLTGVAKPRKLPVAKPIVVTTVPSLSKIRDEIVVYYARKFGIDTARALDISHAENWTGDPKAVNPHSGAIGLMQVMPLWKGTFPECGTDLFNAETNICYGMNIYRLYLVECDYNTFCAESRYNGASTRGNQLAYQSEIGRAHARRAGQ